MEMIPLFIDGLPVEVPEGQTIMQAAERAGKHIPTLCYLPDVHEIGACRVCVVEVEGAKALMPACITRVTPGMKVSTNSPRVRRARRTVVSLLVSDHDGDCLTCDRSGNCELQRLCEEMGLHDKLYQGAHSKRIFDDSTPSIVRDSGKCILCRRCLSVCGKVQGVSAIAPIKRGFATVIAPQRLKKLAEVPCTQCGQCINVCPTGALVEKSYVDEVWQQLANPDKYMVVQVAPAVRAALGEEFGLKPGTLVTGKTVAALKKLGFDKVFDTNFTADLTILEEGSEFLHRLKNGGKLPLLTSCSPGWINFMEHFYPDMLDHLSTCKSPQQMFGAVIKTYFAEKIGIDPASIYTVSVMPCTAKKYECKRLEMSASGYTDVDAVLTTRELAKMIKQARIDFTDLTDEVFDEPFGPGTGAGVIFGATGGVMEAALRTIYEVVSGETLPKLEFSEVRGLTGVKEAEVHMPVGRADAEVAAGGEGGKPGLTVKVAVAHGLANARKLVEQIQAGRADYHFVEVMCCPGGCIGGGGQPIPTNDEIREKRMAALYREDASLPLRKSHENPAVKMLYAEFLDHPLSEKAHHLLHTHYIARDS